MKKYLWGIPIGLVTGFFGSGGGVFAVCVLKRFCSLDAKKAHATAISVILPLSAASLFVYRRSVSPDWRVFLLAALGGVIGGSLGALFLKKIPKRWLGAAFGAVMLIAGGRMIF